MQRIRRKWIPHEDVSTAAITATPYGENVAGSLWGGVCNIFIKLLRGFCVKMRRDLVEFGRGSRGFAIIPDRLAVDGGGDLYGFGLKIMAFERGSPLVRSASFRVRVVYPIAELIPPKLNHTLDPNGSTKALQTCATARFNLHHFS